MDITVCVWLNLRKCVKTNSNIILPYDGLGNCINVAVIMHIKNRQVIKCQFKQTLSDFFIILNFYLLFNTSDTDI